MALAMEARTFEEAGRLPGRMYSHAPETRSRGADALWTSKKYVARRARPPRVLPPQEGHGRTVPYVFAE